MKSFDAKRQPAAPIEAERGAAEPTAAPEQKAVVRPVVGGVAFDRGGEVAGPEDHAYGAANSGDAVQRHPAGRHGVIGLEGGELDEATERVLRSKAGGGRAIAPAVRGPLESAFGADFSRVRLHADEQAAALNRDMSAKAFTHGRDIYFRDGPPDTGTADGLHLLAHELTHTVQQRTAGVRRKAVVGPAADPVEREAELVADSVVHAIMSGAPSALERPILVTHAGGPDVSRIFGLDKKTPESQAKERFEKALKGKSIKGQTPTDQADGATRVTTLRTLVQSMTAAERKAIWSDKSLMTKARSFVGPVGYTDLVGALGMTYEKKGKKGKSTRMHLTGAEADAFIQANMGAIGHLKPFVDTAVAAGRSGDGHIAIVGDDDWKRTYKATFSDPFGEDLEQSTTAFTDAQQASRPVILKHDRGTPSTAIHESMHRYSDWAVLNTYGEGLNEGMTEYFTRRITTKDAQPLNGGKSDRSNYPKEFAFVEDLLAILESSVVAAETKLADIYFSGQIGLLKTTFLAGCTAAKLKSSRANRRWTDFAAAITSGDWDAARQLFPPPPAPAAPAPPQPAAQPAAVPATNS